MICRKVNIFIGLSFLFLGVLSTGFYDQAIAQKTSDMVSGDDVVKELTADNVGMDTNKKRATLTNLLADRAEELSGRIALAIDRIDDLEVQRKEIPDDTDIARLFIAVAKSLDTNTTSMELTIGLMEILELDTNMYRAQLVEATRDISSGFLDTGVAVSIAGHAMERVTSWFFDNGLKSYDKILDDPAPMVHLHTLGESSVDFVVRPWAKIEDYWDVYWHVTKAVKLQFDKDGISIPFPQRDVHVYNKG